MQPSPAGTIDFERNQRPVDSRRATTPIRRKENPIKHHQPPEPEQEAQPRDGPRIYVASLSDYNAGHLHGQWIDADQPTDDLANAITEMLRRSAEPGAEEWAIHDYQGFGPLHLGEYTALPIISAIALGIAEHGPAFAAWADHVDQDPERLPQFGDAYRGRWASIEAYVEELLDCLGATAALAAIPDWLQPHVSLDLAGFARDLRLSGDIWTSPAAGGQVDVFDGTVD